METKHIIISGKDASEFPLAVKAELNPDLIIQSSSNKTFFFTADDYSFFQHSNLSISLFVDIVSDKKCTADIIVAGGKTGLFQLDIFATEAGRAEGLFDGLKSICEKHNWEIEEEEKTF